MPDIYISREQLQRMTYEELYEALDVQEWDWRADFERTSVTNIARFPPPLPAVEPMFSEYWLEVS